MPDEVMEQVNHLGHDQPEQILFTNRHGNPIGDHDPDIPGVPGANTTNEDGANDNDDVELPGVDTGDDDDDQALPDIFEADDDDQAPADVP